MKKVAIYTLQEFNYGNRLQNYATQEVIKSLGYEPVSLYLDSYKNKMNEYISVHPYLSYVRFFAPCFRSAKDWYDRIIKKNRSGNFKSFNKLINYATKDQYISANECSVNPNLYYAFVAGSDQIWNTTFPTCSENAFFPFKHNRKIAFSASFGVSSILKDTKIVDGLNDFHFLSTREEHGVQIIKDFTGKDATLVVDPTMLLSVEDWRKVSKKPKDACGKRYILSYFLSPMSRDAKKQLGLYRKGRDIYKLMGSDSKEVSSAGPSEFLWLFDHADLVLTDSFHACVFAFLFNKPFLVFDRNWDKGNMNSRLDTLLSKFDLQRKHFEAGLANQIFEHDYKNGYRQLEVEKNKAICFLRDALNGS